MKGYKMVEGKKVKAIIKTTIFAFVLVIPVSAMAQPSILVQPTEYDFGAVRGGEVLRHIFEIRNKGSEDLVVEKLDAA